MGFVQFSSLHPGSNGFSELAQMLFKDRQLRADRNLRQQRLNQNAISSIFRTFNQTMAIVQRRELGEERNKILQDAAQSRFSLGLLRQQGYDDRTIAITERAINDRVFKATKGKFLDIDTFTQFTAANGLDPQEALGKFADGFVFGISPEQEQAVAAHDRQKELIQNDPDFGQGANHPDALQVQNAANSVIDQNIARASEPRWYKPKTPAFDAFKQLFLTDEQANEIGLPVGEGHLWMFDGKNVKDVLGEMRREDAKVARDLLAQQAKDAALEIKADERQAKADEKAREDAPAVLNGITLTGVKASELEDLRRDELERRIKHNEKVNLSLGEKLLSLEIHSIDEAVERTLRITERGSMKQFDTDVATRKEEKARRNLSLEQRILNDMKAKTRLEQRIVNHTNRLLEPDLPPVEKEHILDELEELLRQQANAE